MRLSATTVFCEDVREEKNGSNTLIGIFADNVILEGTGEPKPVPAGRKAIHVMPKIGIYTRIVAPIDEPLDRIDVLLVSPDGDKRGMGDFSKEFLENTRKDARGKGSPVITLIARAVASPFPVPPSGGRFLVVVQTQESQIVSGTMNVLIGPSDPTASQPPSSQSPPDAPAS